MGKIQRQYSETVKTKQDESMKKKKSGRPINCQIETLFINIIRDSKLQAINAEAELELEIAFFTNDDDKKSRKRQESSVSDKWLKIFEFASLNPDDKNKLNEIFDNYQKEWKFEQIQEESDLPEYFFDDSNDLAFILHHIITSRRQAVKKQQSSHVNSQDKQNKCFRVKAEELFYVCLLCLKQKIHQCSSRQNLRDVVLDFLLKNENLIVNILRASMQKARTKYNQKINKDKENHKPFDQNQNSKTIKQSQIPYDQSVFDQSQFSRANTQKKNIQKPLQKRKRQFSLNSDDSQEPMTQKEKDQKLIMCFVNYISWSFYYVFGEDEKLLKDAEKQQPPRRIENDKSF